MKTLTIQFPVGLTSRLVESLKPIAIRDKSQNGIIVKARFVGVEDDAEAACEKLDVEILN